MKIIKIQAQKTETILVAKQTKCIQMQNISIDLCARCSRWFCSFYSFFLQTWGDLSNVFVSISPHKFYVKDETRRALCVQSL